VKVAIITDTTSHITKAIADEYGIRLVHLYIVIDGKTYFEDNVDLDWYYKHLPTWKEKHKMLKSSAPSIGDFLNAYQDASIEADAVVDISLSSKFGATYSSALQATRIAAERNPEVPFMVVDTLTTCAGQMFVAREAARAAAQGKRLTEVLDITEQIIKKVNYFILSEDLSSLADAGRTHRASNWVGSKISNFVIMEVDSSTGGEHKPISRHRTQRQAFQRLTGILKERSGGKKIHLAIIHADAETAAKELKSGIMSHFECVDYYESRAFPIVALHGGLGSLKLGWWHED